jgi:hypothetical protein
MCTNATLKGTYGYYRRGNNHPIDSTTNLPLPGPITDIAAVGFVTFDGKGGTSGFQHISRNGVFTTQSGPGTYSVSPDCTFTFSGAANNIVANGVIVGTGDELFALSMTPGNAVILVAKKMEGILPRPPHKTVVKGAKSTKSSSKTGSVKKA